MEPIPLNVVWSTVAGFVADFAAYTAGIVVAMPVAGNDGTAADVRAARAGAMADTAVAAANIADNAADSADDLYGRACLAPRHCSLHVPRSTRSGRRFWL